MNNAGEMLWMPIVTEMRKDLSREAVVWQVVPVKDLGPGDVLSYCALEIMLLFP